MVKLMESSMLVSIMNGEYEVNPSMFAMVHHDPYYHENYVYFSCRAKPIRMTDEQWKEFKQYLTDEQANKN